MFAAVGGLVGNAGGGFVAVALGYQEGFLIAAGLSAAAMLVVAVMPQLPRRAAMTLREILGPVPGVFRNRATLLPAVMALGTSLHVSVLSSVGAAVYKEFGLSDDAFGVLMAIHAGGAIVAGFLFARLLQRVGQRPTFAVTMALHGLPLIGIVLLGGSYPLAVALMFILGLSFNAGRVLNVSLTAIASSPEQRGRVHGDGRHLLGVRADAGAAAVRTARCGHEPHLLLHRRRRSDDCDRAAHTAALHRCAWSERE